MTDTTRAEERALARLDAAKAQLKKVRADQRKKDRRKRDTALFTLGATMMSIVESGTEEDRATALKFWDRIGKRYAPGILTDARRDAISDTPFKPPEIEADSR